MTAPTLPNEEGNCSDSWAPLIAPGDAELALALRLFEEHDGLGMFDAVLAATVMFVRS